MYLFIYLLQNRTHGTRKKNKKNTQRIATIMSTVRRKIKLSNFERNNMETAEPSRMFNT